MGVVAKQDRTFPLSAVFIHYFDLCSHDQQYTSIPSYTIALFILANSGCPRDTKGPVLEVPANISQKEFDTDCTNSKYIKHTKEKGKSHI